MHNVHSLAPITSHSGKVFLPNLSQDTDGAIRLKSQCSVQTEINHCISVSPANHGQFGLFVNAHMHTDTHGSCTPFFFFPCKNNFESIADEKPFVTFSYLLKSTRLLLNQQKSLCNFFLLLSSDPRGAAAALLGSVCPQLLQHEQGLSKHVVNAVQAADTSTTFPSQAQVNSSE